MKRSLFALACMAAAFSGCAADGAKAPVAANPAAIAPSAPVAAAPVAAPAAAGPTAKTPAKGDPLRGKELAAGVCAACHGADGNSMIPVNPTLAGQDYDYLLKQMKNFKSVDGKPARRANPVMNGMIAAVEVEQMKDMAAWFASQKPKGGAARNRASVEAGQKLYRAGDAEKGIPSCASCHGPTGAGMPSQFPRVSGQHAEYAEAQLKAFRDGTRANDPNKMMRSIALKMTDPEIKAVSDYMAGLH